MDIAIGMGKEKVVALLLEKFDALGLGHIIYPPTLFTFASVKTCWMVANIADFFPKPN
jgi:hypothetical protein